MNIIKSMARNNLYNFNEDHLISCQQELKDLLSLPANIDTCKLLNELRFVTIDLETTGFKPTSGDQVLSVGGIILENGKINYNDTFYELVNPNRNIPDIITKLTGITELMVKDKPIFLEILPSFISWINNNIIVGHIIEFDLLFLNHYLYKNCGLKLKHNYIDTRKLIVTLYPHFTNCSLEEICYSLRIPTQDRHNALGDAIMAAKIFEFSIKELARRGVYTLEDLNNFLRVRQYFASPLPQIII